MCKTPSTTANSNARKSTSTSPVRLTTMSNRLRHMCRTPSTTANSNARKSTSTSPVRLTTMSNRLRHMCRTPSTTANSNARKSTSTGGDRFKNKERGDNGPPEPSPPRPSFFKRLRRVFWRRKRPNRKPKRGDYVNVDPVDISSNHFTKSGKRLTISRPMPIEPASPPNTLKTAPPNTPKTALEIEATPSIPACTPVILKKVEQTQTESSAASAPAETNQPAVADPDLDVDKITAQIGVNTKDAGDTSDDSDEDVCATYVPMGKPLRGLRKSKTFNEGMLTKPHIFTHQYPSNTPPPCQNFRDTLHREEERPSDIYQNSAIEDVDDKDEEDDHTQLKYFSAFNELPRQVKQRSVYMEPEANLRDAQPRGLPRSSTDLTRDRPTDDLFKWGWWKPEKFSHNELETKHDGVVNVVPDFDLYVRMGGRSTRCQPPPGDGRRSRSLTVPNIFSSELEDDVSDDLPKLSLWCPPSPSGELNSGSTIKFNTCPRPCSVAHYVNFKGSIPPK